MSQNDLQDILSSIHEFEASPDYVGLGLKVDLSRIVLRRLREKGWTQRRLATACGMKESFVSRVIHSDDNCTLDTVGRLMFALGVDIRLEEVRQSSIVFDQGTTATLQFKFASEVTHGEEEIRKVTIAQTAESEGAGPYQVGASV